MQEVNQYVLVHPNQVESTKELFESVGVKLGSNSSPAKKAKTGRRESTKMMRIHVGPRVGRAAACGHQVIQHNAPHTKCFDCWHLYFSTNVKQTYALFSFLQEGREAELAAVHGAKFVKMFKKYVTHVQNIAPIQAEDAVANG